MAISWNNSFERVINRAIGQEIGDSAFAQSVLLDRVWGKRQLKTGTYISQPIISGSDGAATMFGLQAVSSAGSSGAITFSESDKLLELTIPFKFLGSTIRINEMRLKQAAGSKEQLYDYFAAQAKVFKQSIQAVLGNQAVNGNPETSGGTTTDLHGLKSIFDVAASYTATPYMEVARSASAAMLPAIFVASSTGTAYTSGTCTGTAGQYFLTGTNATWSGNVNEGDALTTGGNTYRIAAVVSTTTLYLATPLLTSPAGATFSVARAFNDTALYGTGNGNLTLAKLDKAFYSAVDGNDAPTLMLSRADLFGHAVSLLAANQRYVGVNVEYNGQSGRRSNKIAYNGADWIADNYMPAGTVYGLNENYIDCYALRGADTFSLKEGSLTQDNSTWARASLVAQVNLGLNIACRALNRQFKIAGFQGY